MGFYDWAYATGLGISAPFWLLAPKARKKVFDALANRMGREPGRQTSHPAIMIHAVSLGEINATPAMVRMLAEARPEVRFVISTTTATGWQRANELYGKDPKVSLIRYPLDFSGAVNRVLDSQRPSAVVLMELEVWPNFTRACARQEIPVILVNGRLTETSFRNYRLASPFTRPMFERLSLVCAQEEAYGRRFVELGVLPDRVRVTGTMKFDTAQIASRIPGAEDLAASVGLKPGAEQVWVCGSSGPGEEEIILDAYTQLLQSHPALRLVIVPRKPERFDEVADLIRSRGFALVRRSMAKQLAGKTTPAEMPILPPTGGLPEPVPQPNPPPSPSEANATPAAATPAEANPADATTAMTTSANAPGSVDATTAANPATAQATLAKPAAADSTSAAIAPASAPPGQTPVTNTGAVSNDRGMGASPVTLRTTPNTGGAPVPQTSQSAPHATPPSPAPAETPGAPATPAAAPLPEPAPPTPAAAPAEPPAPRAIVILGDTMGELRGFYSLADVVFVGRTLLDLGRRQHGSDMIEPAALAKPVIVGPYTGNFAEAVNRFREADAIRELHPGPNLPPAQALRDAVAELLFSSGTSADMGRRAQEVVKNSQGVTRRNVDAILTFLVSPALAGRRRE